jgi:hypothetical protein
MIRTLIIALLLFVCAGLPARTQEPMPERRVTLDVRDTSLRSAISGQAARAPEPPEERRVTLNLRDIPLRSAIELLFQGTGYQFAVAPGVPNPLITLNLKDLPFKQALRTFIRLASPQVPGLTFTEDNNIYVIRTTESVVPAGGVRLEKIPVSFLRVEDLVARLNSQLLPRDVEAIEPQPADNSLIVRAPETVIGQLRTLVRLLDIPPHQLVLRASVQGPGSNGRPLNFQATARTMNGGDVTLDEQTQVGAQVARMKVKLAPFVQGDGNIRVESDWDISVPVAGGARGPIRLVKRLNTTTTLVPGQGASVSEVDLSPWGSSGTVRLWLRADLLPEPMGRAACGPAGERLGRVQLVDNRPYLDLFALAEALHRRLAFDPATGTYQLDGRGTDPRLQAQPGSAGPFRLALDDHTLSTRVVLKGSSRLGGLPISTRDGSPYVPLEDLARALGARLRFDPATDTYHLTGGTPLVVENRTNH